jgi:hypothetical protein
MGLGDEMSFWRWLDKKEAEEKARPWAFKTQKKEENDEKPTIIYNVIHKHTELGHTTEKVYPCSTKERAERKAKELFDNAVEKYRKKGGFKSTYDKDGWSVAWCYEYYGVVDTSYHVSEMVKIEKSEILS